MDSWMTAAPEMITSAPSAISYCYNISEMNLTIMLVIALICVVALIIGIWRDK